MEVCIVRTIFGFFKLKIASICRLKSIFKMWLDSSPLNLIASGWKPLLILKVYEQ